MIQNAVINVLDCSATIDGSTDNILPAPSITFTSTYFFKG
jgi:hypothetical protein